MAAVRQEYAQLSGRFPKVVQFETDTRAQTHRSKPSRDSNLNEAIDLVTATADILDELMRQNDALEAEASKRVARYKGQALAAQRESDSLRAELQNLQQMNARLAAEDGARAHQFEEILEKKNQELDIAKQWIEHFRSRLTELLFNVAKELEMRPNAVSSGTPPAAN